MKRSTVLILVCILSLILAAALVAQNPAGGYTSPQTGVSFPLLAPSGSVSAPSYSFSASPNTGLFYSGSTWNIAGAGVTGLFGNGSSVVSGLAFTSPTYSTTTNCSSSASPAVCSSAAAGSVVVAAAATTVQVNTTAVTANSQILLTRDDSLGTKLSVTCNTATVMGEMKVSARTGGTSFTITVQTAPATNPGCISYSIVN